MSDRLNFRAGITLSYTNDNGDDSEVQLLLYGVSVDSGGKAINVHLNTIKQELEQSGLSKDEQEHALEYLYANSCCSNDYFYIDWVDFVDQCTGLKDKKGIFIYESDIVELTRSRNYGWCRRGTRLDVKWNTFSCCGFGFGAIGNLTRKCADNCIVIGNIHQNKELLEEE